MEMVGFECAGIGYTQGFGELLHREHHGERQERHGDGDHVMLVEWVWDFVMDGGAPSGAVAASMVYGKIMRGWRWQSLVKEANQMTWQTFNQWVEWCRTYSAVRYSSTW